jgi:hypothetical protein
MNDDPSWEEIHISGTMPRLLDSLFVPESCAKKNFLDIWTTLFQKSRRQKNPRYRSYLVHFTRKSRGLENPRDFRITLILKSRCLEICGISGSLCFRNSAIRKFRGISGTRPIVDHGINVGAA